MTELTDKECKYQIWKISHGQLGNMTDGDHKLLMENNLVAIGHADNKRRGYQQRTDFISIKSGDYFYLVRKSHIVLWGRFDTPVLTEPPKEFSRVDYVARHFKPIMGVKFPSANLEDESKDRFGWHPSVRTTCFKVPFDKLNTFEKDILKPVFDLSLPNESESPEDDTTEGIENMTNSLNRILYGPPGTGKTFNTTNLALKIIGEEGVDDQPRERLKQIFDTKMQEQQIFFTTFHQSMSYEDFIEGIKPVEPKQDGHSVNYKIIDGIFKKACAVAAYNCYKLFNSTKTQQKNYSFDDLYSAFINSINEKIEAGSFPVYKSIKGKDIEVKFINGNDSVIARAKNSVSNKSAPLTKENLQKLYDAFESVDEIEELQQIKDIVQIFPRISEFYAVFKGLKEFESTYKVDDELISEVRDSADIDFEEIQKKFNERVFNASIKEFGNDADPVVIIIDEINRGNVSQIFGELITLIEEDKRLGKDEAIQVTLPYSKKLFGVPPNLYIIGTMNTADRSVEALDAALRRRFNFVEMLPDPNLIKTKGALSNSLGFLKEIDLPDLLYVINCRIEKLIDKDHQIGHSYFMSILTINDLKVAFKNKIIPLLQEYFFGDYGKIGLVLGKGFVETSETSNDSIFADFDSEYASDFSDRVIYKIKNIDQMEDRNFIAAINLLLKK